MNSRTVSRGRSTAGCRYRLSDLDADGRMSGEPLIAAQHRSRSADNPRQDGEICLRRDLERAEIECGQARSPGKCPFREEHQDAALARKGDQCLGIRQTSRNVVALDERYSKTPQQQACNELPG